MFTTSTPYVFGTSDVVVLTLHAEVPGSPAIPRLVHAMVNAYPSPPAPIVRWYRDSILQSRGCG